MLGRQDKSGITNATRGSVEIEMCVVLQSHVLIFIGQILERQCLVVENKSATTNFCDPGYHNTKIFTLLGLHDKIEKACVKLLNICDWLNSKPRESRLN